MMAVVAIVGILATLATYGVNRYIQSSKSSEAIQMLGSIKSAQEAYRAETFIYKDVSGDKKLTTFYPQNTPTAQAYQWDNAGTNAQAKAFRELGVFPDAPTRFVYTCAAGAAADNVPVSGMTITNWPTTVQ